MPKTATPFSLFFYTLLLLFFAIGCKPYSDSQNKGSVCDIAKRGKFVYDSSVWRISVYRNDSIQNDKLVNAYTGEVRYLKSKVEWLDDCEYNLILISSSSNKFKYPPGTILNVKIDSIRDTTIYYTRAINGDSMNGKMQKVE